MLETCRGGPRPVKLCVEKTKNVGQIQPLWNCRQKWAKILIGPFSPNLKPLEQGACPTCTCLKPVRLCVEKTKNVGQIQPLWNCRQKWAKILIGPFSPNLKPLE